MESLLQTQLDQVAAGSGRVQQSLAHQLGGSGGSMDLGALGLKRTMFAHEVNVGLALALMNHDNRNARKVIDSLGQ